MKRLTFILIPALILASTLFLAFHYFIKLRSQKGAMQVTSSPESKVYLGSQYLGQTPLCRCDANDMLTAGEYTIRLVPLDNSLSEFQEKITISEGILTVVDRKFGKDSLSEGSILSLSRLKEKDKTQLVVVSFPGGSSVALDSNEIGITPLSHENLTDSDHILKVTKHGYKEKTIRLRAKAGYKVTVAVYLSIDDLIEITPTPSSSQSASIAPSVLPSPSLVIVQAVILDTPTGFLRVRESNSINSTEIGQVSPGEKYPLLDEQGGWFKIKLSEKQEGWISAQYAKKE